MNLGMLTAQPRNVVAKLNGHTATEEDVILSSLVPVCRDPGDEPQYRVAAVRVATVEHRHRATLHNLLDQGATVQQCIQDLQSTINALLDQYGDLVKDHSIRKTELQALAKAFRNAYPKSPFLTNKDIGNITGWSASKIRKIAQTPAFRKEMIPGSKGNGNHKKYSISILEVIENELEKQEQEGRPRRTRK